ncbi:MAG: hypothetical protein AB7N91_07085 [Candidatus Tectimicrobiota bacterium]
MQPAVLQWFMKSIEMFAPAAYREERQQFYADLLAYQSVAPLALTDHLGLYVLAQIVAAQQTALPLATGKRAERLDAHATWYEKERQRIAKMLQQIAESPVVSSFASAVTYYEADEVTCEHGRNQKTCEELYALCLTLQMLERHQGARWVRKQVERLRQREPHLPLLNDLCAPLATRSEASWLTGEAAAATVPPAVPPPADELATYLLGTMVGRLRQAGLTVAQSCALVDRALCYCFGRPDPTGTRPARLAEQWRRLN